MNSKICCAAGCGSSCVRGSTQEATVRLHRFPQDDTVATRWMEILELQMLDLRLEDIRASDLKLCSKHFDDESYTCPPGMRNNPGSRLAWNALPNLEKVLPRLLPDGLQPVILRTDEEADNMYPPVLIRERLCGQVSAESLESDKFEEQPIESQVFKRTLKLTIKTKVKSLSNKNRRQQASIRKLRLQISRLKTQRTIEKGQSGRFLKKKLRQRKCQGMRWKAEDIARGIKLHHKSPAAYRLLRQDRTLPLPSESTLKRCVRRFFLTSGLCSQTMRLLSEAMNKRKQMERIATLCFDGMSLARSIRYDQCQDVVTGLVSSKVTGEHKPVDEAVVAILRGVATNWKQPIAYYPVRSTLGQQGFNDAIQECLVASHEAGIRVAALVADQETTQWASKLVTPSKPFISHPVTKDPVFIVIDVPHCLKNARNALLKYNIEFDGGKLAKWEHLVKFYQEECGRELRLAKKLSDLHFTLRLGKKMKVSLAAQIFSHSVAAGIRTLVHHGKMSEESLQTADFVEKLNDSFDLLNSTDAMAKGFHRPIFRDTVDEQIEMLDQVREFISSWRFQPIAGGPVKSRMKFQTGWSVSIASLASLSKHLISTEGFQFVYLRRFTQDHVENLFCIIRGRNGFNDRPELSAFVGALRSVASSGLAHSGSSNANCEDDGGVAAVRPTLVASNTPTLVAMDDGCCTVYEKIRDSHAEAPETDEMAEISLGDVTIDIVEYIAGYVILKSGVLVCSTCRTALLMKDESGAFIREKQLPQMFTGLTKPSADALQGFMRMEVIFKQHIDHLFQHSGVSLHMLETFRVATVRFPSCLAHSDSNWVKLTQRFVRLRLHHWCRLKSRSFQAAASSAASWKKLKKF